MREELRVEADKAALEQITNELGGFAYKAPTVLKDAANAAGKYAVKETIKAADRRYDYNHARINLANEVKRKSATYANPRTVISVESQHMNKMIHFNVTPGRVANASGRPKVYKGRVLKSSSMKPLYDHDRGNVKMFMVRFSRGGIQVVSRVPGERYSSSSGGKLKERVDAKLDPTRIEVEYAPSDTHMFSRAFDDVRENVGEKLQIETKKQINKFLKGVGV